MHAYRFHFYFSTIWLRLISYMCGNSLFNLVALGYFFSLVNIFNVVEPRKVEVDGKPKIIGSLKMLKYYVFVY